MYDVNKDLAHVREVSDQRWKELSGLRGENQVYQRQVRQLMDEKAEMATELYGKLEHERVSCDQKLKEQSSKIEDLTEQIRNLQFSLVSSQERATEFEEKYTQFRQEIRRVQQEEKDAKERQIQSETIKENMKTTYLRETNRLRQQVQELTTEMEQIQLQQEYRDQRVGEQSRAKLLHHHEMLAKQERIAENWKRELEKTSQAYENMIAKLQVENKQMRTENEHWRSQLQKAHALRSERINNRMKEIALKQMEQEDEEKAQKVDAQ